MSEQKYRVIVQDWMKNWGYTALTSSAAQADIIDRLVRTEHPVPTTDITAMSHESTGFCFCGQLHGRIDAWNEHDWAALREYMPAVHPVPDHSLPTREQIAEVLHRSDESASYDPFDYDRGADAVLALIQNGVDR